MSNASTRSVNELPACYKDYFARAASSLNNLLNIVEISECGIRTLALDMHAISLKVLMDAGKLSKGNDVLGDLNKQTSLAKSEIASGFPVLHRLAIVALWSFLEHFVKHSLSLWIQNNHALASAECRNSDAFKKLEVNLVDYSAMSDGEKAFHVVSLLERQLKSPIKRGVDRFEVLLEPFGLSDSVSKDCKERIFQLQQFRNAIAHNNGYVDVKLRETLPQFDLTIGEPVSIDQATFRDFALATYEYFGEIMLRFAKRLGKVVDVDMSAADFAAAAMKFSILHAR